MKFGNRNQESHKFEGLMNATTGGCIPCIQRNGFENKKIFPFLRFQLQHDIGLAVFCDHLNLIQTFSMVFILFMK